MAQPPPCWPCESLVAGKMPIELIWGTSNGTFDQPGCIVSDIEMPGLSGLELQDNLGQRGIHLPIIMLTGHATVDSAVECTKLGAFKYLEKPYAFEKLVETVTEAYEARLKKKFEHNQKRIEEIQKLSISSSPLGLLRALARLDDEEK